MKKALKNAQVKPAQVDYVNAHATSTPLGDAAENAAVEALLSGADGHSNVASINVSSTKGALGHLLGAAGAVEAIFAILAIHEVRAPSACVTSSNRYGLEYPAPDHQYRQPGFQFQV